MAINWVSVKKTTTMKSDVQIYFTSGGGICNIVFSNGTMGVKFGHKPKVQIGFEESGTRMYFLPNDSVGYKVQTQDTGRGRIAILASRLEDTTNGKVRISGLLGDYTLRKDEEAGAWYISIGAMTR